MVDDNNLEWELPHDADTGDSELVPAGVDLIPGNAAYEHIRAELIARIQHLLLHDFDGLTAILYRLDVPEGEAAVALKMKDSLLAATGVADAVLRREVKKREQRRNPGSS